MKRPAIVVFGISAVDLDRPSTVEPVGGQAQHGVAGHFQIELLLFTPPPDVV
jgi:hypothetical protein